jgi:ABC-2 type transport system ATP-binding protein
VEPVIQVQDLVKRYKKADRNAVDGISFSVEAGSFFALLGPNGAGKTTTISVLTTTLLPTSGTIKVAGFDIVRQASRVRRNIGIIFQRPSLDINLTAEENVRFHAVLYGLYPFRPSFRMMPASYREQLMELAELLDLRDDIFKPIKTYSGGMMRKLEIVRSLIHRPRVLFLDEPTSGLDPLSRRNLWSYLRDVRKESGTTVFLTTHYLEEAEGADAVCILNRGQVVSYGTPAQVRADLVQECVVIDAADRARLRRELQEGGLQFEETPPFRISIDGRSVHQLLKSLETPLTLVETHSPSLEDAYLAIVAREGEDE